MKRKIFTEQRILNITKEFEAEIIQLNYAGITESAKTYFTTDAQNT